MNAITQAILAAIDEGWSVTFFSDFWNVGLRLSRVVDGHEQSFDIPCDRAHINEGSVDLLTMEIRRLLHVASTSIKAEAP